MKKTLQVILSVLEIVMYTTGILFRQRPWWNWHILTNAKTTQKRRNPLKETGLH